MLKRTTKPLRRIPIEESLARSSNKQHSENTGKWYLCKAGSFSYSESPQTPSLEGTSHSTGETMMWGDPGGSWACLPPVYDYEWNHTARSAEHAPKSSLQNMPQKAVEKKEVLQNAEKKLVSSRIFIFRQPYRVTSGRIIHSVTLYQGKTISYLNTSLKKRQPTILDTTQSTANTTSISIYIWLIYN